MDFLTQIIERVEVAIYTLIVFRYIAFTMIVLLFILIFRFVSKVKLGRLVCDRYKNALKTRAFLKELKVIFSII
nr:hypothetical protein A152_03395 [Vibrio tasmaniensis 1F-187]